MVKRQGLKWLTTAFLFTLALWPFAGVAAAKADAPGTHPHTVSNAPAGWQNGPVTITLSASDPDSDVVATYYTVDGGPDQSGTSFVVDGEGVHTISFWSVDALNNTEAPNTVLVKIDLTPPAIAFVARTADGNPYTSYQWTNQDVTVTYTCADQGGSGVEYCPQPQVQTEFGSLSGYVRDWAGNITNSDDVFVYMDRTPPAITATAETDDGMPYFSGTPVNQGVLVRYRCTDEAGGSGIATCPDPETFTAAGTAGGQAVDNAGNVGRLAEPFVINIGEPKPSITATAVTADGKPYQLGSWTNQSVTVTFTCENVTSCPQPQTFTASGVANVTVDDGAGNTATITVAINIDTTKPTITWTGNQSSYAAADLVQITCTPADADTGLATYDCPSVNAPAASLGTGVVTLSATATDLAGNVTTSQISFTVTSGGGGSTDPGAAFDDLCSLTKQLVTKDGIAKSLCAKLNNAKAAAARGDLKAKANMLEAYLHEVAAQTGKAITKTNADRLTAAARKL